MKPRNARRVERLHGELYRALAAEAGRLGCRPATLAAHILQVEATRQGIGGGAQSVIHPLAEAYLPQHNPRPAEGERARMLTITAPPELFRAFFEQACTDAAALGHERPPGFEPAARAGKAEPPEARDFRRAAAERHKLLLVSCLVGYLERVGCL